MDYQEAIDHIAAGVPIARIAQEAGVPEVEIRRARLDPSSKFYLSPPSSWKRLLAQLAAERAAALQNLATELESEAESSGV